MRLLVNSEGRRQEALIDLTNKIISKNGFWYESKNRVKKRTPSQNRLLYLWETCIYKDGELGYYQHQIHELNIEMFAPKEELEIGGITILVPVRTSHMNVAQKAEYLTKIQRFYETEHNVILPDPEDRKFEQFVQHYDKEINRNE